MYFGEQMKKKYLCFILSGMFVLLAGNAYAADTFSPKVVADTMWVIMASGLVFFMNSGFAMVESGLCRSKNTVNILAKNVIVFGLAAIAYWSFGFGFMFGNGNAFIGLEGWFMSGADNSPAIGEAYKGVFASLNWTGIPLEAKFLFQMCFAATAATIVSGTVAERINLWAFIVFAILLTLFVYPLPGHWIWGGGWLADKGFSDFAGSTAVHSVGGWAALTGAIILGPRMGKYDKNGAVKPIAGHNMGFATLGMFILWLGWFGFNGGSTMAADPVAVSHIVLTTNMAAVAGLIASTVIAQIYLGMPDLSMAINGALAGLVAVTAGCDVVSVGGALIIGAVGGAIAVFAVTFFDKLHIDDPVGALSVHLVNGVLGTLAVGFFSTSEGLFYGKGVDKVISQLIGIGATGVYTVITTGIIWYVIKVTIGLRVSEEEEEEGLDLGEHGMEAYPDFAIHRK